MSRYIQFIVEIIIVILVYRLIIYKFFSGLTALILGVITLIIVYAITEYIFKH